MSQWGGVAVARGRPRDRQVLFVVRYRSGPDAYLRVPPQIGVYGASPVVLNFARDRQARGELPAGEIATVLRVR
jgi:hypothetical protein